jgi:hypothetical protein
MAVKNLIDELTPKQQAAILALLAEPTTAKAAERAGVPERTLYNWLNEPVFMDEYRRCRRESFKQAIGLAQRYVPLAVQTLAKVMHDADAPHSAKVSAATALMKFSRESLELDDLSARIEALEKAGNEQPKNPWMPPRKSGSDAA